MKLKLTPPPSFRFYPNQRTKVDAIRSKTFCVQHLGSSGQRLMTASQDHNIRIYEKADGRNFCLERTLQVPYVGWSILDVAVSPDGRDLVYSTWDTAMYQCSIDDPTDTWIPLRVEAQDLR